MIERTEERFGFLNEIGQESPGAFTGPTQVTAFLWGLQGDVYPNMIV